MDRLIGERRGENTVEGGRRVNVRDQNIGRVEGIGRGRGNRNGKGRKSILDDFALTVQRSVPSIYPSYYIVNSGAGHAERELHYVSGSYEMALIKCLVSTMSPRSREKVGGGEGKDMCSRFIQK